MNKYLEILRKMRYVALNPCDYDTAFGIARTNHVCIERDEKLKRNWSLMECNTTGELILYSTGSVSPEMVKAALLCLEGEYKV